MKSNYKNNIDSTSRFPNDFLWKTQAERNIVKDSCLITFSEENRPAKIKERERETQFSACQFIGNYQIHAKNHSIQTKVTREEEKEKVNQRGRSACHFDPKREP